MQHPGAEHAVHLTSLTPPSADTRLIQCYRDGASLTELSDEFGRNVGGTASRLKLHNLLPPTGRNGEDDPNTDYADISAPGTDPDWP